MFFLKVLDEWRLRSANAHPLCYYHEECQHKGTWYTWNDTLRKAWKDKRLPIFRQLAVECGLENVDQLLKLDLNDELRNGDLIRNLYIHCDRINQYFYKHADCSGFKGGLDRPDKWYKYCEVLDKKQYLGKGRKNRVATKWKLPNLSR